MARPGSVSAATASLWAATAGPAPPLETGRELPPRTDVAIIGGGYTGLSAARALGRSGAHVTLLERETLGWGASGRNGGFVLPGFKREPAALLARFGEHRSRELYELSLASVRRLEEIIDTENLDCEYRRCGHLVLADRPSHLRALEHSARLIREKLGGDVTIVPPGELYREIGSRRYHGGLLDVDAGALHPLKFLHGLAASAAAAGAGLYERCEVTGLARRPHGFEVSTRRGTLHADEVLVGTNGYTGAVTPRLLRGIVPLGSHLVATVPLDPEVAERCIPRGRVLSDTKHLLYYFRMTAERRLLFGGRVAFRSSTPAGSERALRRGIAEVFPELARVPVEYAWSGRLGMTWDQLPHAGRLDGLHYAMGYCGHGVAMATYLGDAMGQALAGRAGPPLPGFDLPAIPLYHGRPWFLPLAGAFYRLKDFLG